MKYQTFQIIAFKGNVPESVIVKNQSQDVLEKFNQLVEAGGSGYDRIEYWRKGILRSKKTFINGKSTSIDIEGAAKKLIDATNSMYDSNVLKEDIVLEHEVLEKGLDQEDEIEFEEDTKESEENPNEINISPAALELANEHGLDVSQLIGSGTNGKIVKSDIEKLL